MVFLAAQQLVAKAKAKVKQNAGAEIPVLG
jgi:hypothetical protein